MIHWVPASFAHPIEILEYDRLFLDANLGREDDFMQFLNQDSLKKRQGYLEPALKNASADTVFQFERVGYYAVNESEDGEVRVCHRVVDLKDTWSKINEK